MCSKALRFSKNNKTVKLAMIPSATNTRIANQQDLELTGEQELKVLVIDRSKFNLPRRIVRWATVYGHERYRSANATSIN
jgi:hypothetical protein